MKRGGKRKNAGRKVKEKTKTKQIRINLQLFEKLKSVNNLSELTIEFWQSLTVVSDCS